MKEKIVFWLAAALFAASSLCVYFVSESFRETKPVAVVTAAVTSEEAQTAPVTESEASSAAPSGTVVNINTAGLDELQTLDGIGAVLAQRIIDYRTENGDFISIDEITEVSGIGEKKFEAIKGRITV